MRVEGHSKTTLKRKECASELGLALFKQTNESDPFYDSFNFCWLSQSFLMFSAKSLVQNCIKESSNPLCI